MKKSKKCVFAVLLFVVSMFCLIMAGCGIFGSNDNNNNNNNNNNGNNENKTPDPVTVNVTSKEDFSQIKYDAETPVNVVLQNDIDLDDIAFSTVVSNSLYTNTLDGNGHTIKNVLLMGSVGGMFSGFSSITNLNVENVQVNLSSTFSTGAFGVITREADSVSKCSVKEVSLTISAVSGTGNIGGIVGTVKNISECTVEGFEANIKSEETIIAGGVAGTVKASATKCEAKDVEIKISLDICDSGTLGGVTGVLESGTTSSDLSANAIDLEIYSIVDRFWGSPAIIGGVTGKSRGILTKAKSENVKIKAESDEHVYGGGISGTVAETGQVTNCYSHNADIQLNTPSGSAGRGYGGGITGIDYGTMTNCYSYKTKITVDVGGDYFVGGVAGLISEGIVTYCASINMLQGSLKGTTYVGATKDFAPIGHNSGSIAHCYYVNANNVSFNSTNDLTVSTLNKELFTDSLKLSDKNWNYDQFDDEAVQTPLPVF